MPIQNTDVATILERVANLLGIQDANPFRVRAYRNAARTVSSLARDIADMVENDENLTELSGIGEDLAGKIEEIVETGTLEQLLELEKELPGELNDLMRIDTLEPKKIHALYTELDISTDAHQPEELEFMRCGVDQARRGWLGPENVLNTRPWDEARNS